MSVIVFLFLGVENVLDVPRRTTAANVLLVGMTKVTRFANFVDVTSSQRRNQESLR